jgi:ubiquinone/menaquinone biosynthesis C-methylase UbiE
MKDTIDYQDYQKALEFDKRAAKMTVLRSLTQVLIDELDPQKGNHVLDVGTGTGRLGIELSTMFFDVDITGIDSGFGMLKVAEEKILRHMVDNYRLVIGQAEALPLLNQVFDSACLLLSFHHFTDPEKALSEIFRILKAKGKLISVDPVLNEPVDEEEKRLNGMIEEAFQLAHGPDFRFFAARTLQKLYEKAGFFVEKSQAHNFTFNQRGLEGIPMGSHWLQVYELLKFRKEEALLDIFEQNYFTFRKKNGLLLVKGKMKWISINALKK